MPSALERWQRRMALSQWLARVDATPDLSDNARQFAHIAIQLQAEDADPRVADGDIARRAGWPLRSTAVRARRELERAGLWPVERAEKADKRAEGERR